LLENLIVFNDPDDDKYVDDDEPLCMVYLNESFANDYMIFRNIAGGNVMQYKYLTCDISRLEMFRIYAMNLTYNKELNQRKYNGR